MRQVLLLEKLWIGAGLPAHQCLGGEQVLVTASCSALDRLVYVFSSASDRARLFENIFKCSKLNIVYMLVHLSICAQGKAFINITFGGKNIIYRTQFI